MKTIITEQNGSYVAAFDGRIDTAASPTVEQDLRPMMEKNPKEIILDCTKLTYISSSGLRVFLGVLKNAKTWGGQVYIKGLNDDIRNIFSITGFINLFQFK